jgi:hypothetical protein
MMWRLLLHENTAHSLWPHMMWRLLLHETALLGPAHACMYHLRLLHNCLWSQFKHLI